MTEPLVALQGAPLQTGEVVRQANADQNADAMNTEQVLKAHYDAMDARDKNRLQSTVIGASQLKSYLDKGDVEGAHDFLVQRQSGLHARMGTGEAVDTQETDYALDKLRKGDVDGLKNDVDAIIAAGQSYGMIGGGGMPASVKEWQYYNSLPADKKPEWMANKRAGSNIDLGDKTIRLGADGKPEATYTKGVTPDNQPANVSAAAAAKTSGTELGVNQAKLADVQAALPALNQVADKLSTLGKTATYTTAGVAKNEVARQLGAEVPQSGVDRTEYISTVDNEVLPLLRQTFGAAFTQKEGDSLRITLGDPNKSPKEKDAVLRAFIEAKTREVETLSRRTGQAAPAGGAPAGAAPAAGKIRVSKGNESFMIDPADLAAAQAEGFQQQ